VPASFSDAGSSTLKLDVSISGSGTPDRNPNNEFASASVQVTAAADLAVDVSSASTHVVAGSEWRRTTATRRRPIRRH
jgi:hypothetical protein